MIPTCSLNHLSQRLVERSLHEIAPRSLTMQRGRMRAEAQSNAEQRRATQAVAVCTSSTMRSARASDPCRGDAKTGTRRPRAQGATGARLSCALFFPQHLVPDATAHTQCCICPVTACFVHVCLPSLCSNRPWKISFLPDRRLSRAIDTSSAHAPAQSYHTVRDMFRRWK
jgi:hypothetical protein